MEAGVVGRGKCLERHLASFLFKDLQRALSLPLTEQGAPTSSPADFKPSPGASRPLSLSRGSFFKSVGRALGCYLMWNQIFNRRTFRALWRHRELFRYQILSCQVKRTPC